MDLSALLLALSVSATMVAAATIGQRSAQARNVTRLAEHFRWRRADALEAYAIAHRVGFGAAYRRVRADRSI